VGSVRQNPHDHPLNQRVITVHANNGREQREGGVTAGIFRFAHGRECGLESAVGEDQEQHSFQPLAGVGRRDCWARNRPVVLPKHEQA